MKFPQLPPAWQPLMDRVIQQGKVGVFMESSHRENLRPERYLHWNEFRHRASSKDGLTVEEQWAALRMARSMRSQSIPLADSQGREFTFYLTPKTYGLLREIDLHCGASPAGCAMVREETRRHQFDSQMEEALTSSRLEGAVVTRSEAREMIRSQRPATTEHERMVINNYRTMRLLGDLKEQALTPEMVLAIHREVAVAEYHHFSIMPGHELPVQCCGDRQFSHREISVGPRLVDVYHQRGRKCITLFRCSNDRGGIQCAITAVRYGAAELKDRDFRS